MSESHKFTSEEKLREAFPDIRLQTNRDTGSVRVQDKDGEYVPVEKGQFVVKVGSRYEVSSDEPEKAKAAAPKASKKTETKKRDEGFEETPKAVEGNQTVVPEELGTPPGPDPS